VVDLATDNVTLLPADWVQEQEYAGMAVPASIFGRAYLIMSLPRLADRRGGHKTRRSNLLS
jgi:hypothetical protein